MLSTGAARSVGVKLFYQLGFTNYLFVVLLYLLGQSLALIFYVLARQCFPDSNEYHDYAPILPNNEDGVVDNTVGDEEYPRGDDSSYRKQQQQQQHLPQQHAVLELSFLARPFTSTAKVSQYQPKKFTVAHSNEDEDEDAEHHSAARQAHPFLHHSQSAPLVEHHSSQAEIPTTIIPQTAATTTTTAAAVANDDCKEMLHRAQSMPLPARRQSLRRQGSRTCLTEESSHAVVWIHSIPWYIKPMIPGLANLANAALKWASFIYVAASIAEMLMSGMELVLSVCLARIVRKRQVSSQRWMGVGIVAAGLWVVHAADYVMDTRHHESLSSSSAMTREGNEFDKLGNDTDVFMTDEKPLSLEQHQHQKEHWIGALLIVGQCLTAVGQDIAEEIFLQEADFPATLLLGMEGIYGLIFGIPLYLLLAPEPISVTLKQMEASSWELTYMILLTFIFLATGIFNIWTTGATSSMTRNMWKNIRTIAVWLLGLILFYALGNDELGEAWIVPDSFFILAGFLIMLSGIYVYYENK